MSYVNRSPNGDFSANAGDSMDPFVAMDDLLLGYVYNDQASWKNGLVEGQVAVAKQHDFVAHTTTVSDAGWTRTPDRMGIQVSGTGYIDLDYLMPQFANDDGIGRTFMTLSGVTEFSTVGYAAFLSIGWLFGDNGLMLGINTTATPNQETGAAVGHVSMNLAASLAQGADRTWLTFLRANGDETWDMIIPNLRARFTKTEAALIIPDPVELSAVSGNPGRVSVMLPNNGSDIGGRKPINKYADAIWGRALTDPEWELQYQRSRLWFPGVLN